MVTPAIYPLTLTRGITFDAFTIQFFTDDAHTMPADLTGWLIWSEVRTDPDETLILNLEPAWIDASIGKASVPGVSIPDETTITLPNGKYKWDLTLQDTSGDRRGPYIKGPFTIKSKITQGDPPE